MSKFKLSDILDNADFTPFIVLSRSRTGSKLLISLLDSHPDIHAQRGLFLNMNGRSREEILSEAFGQADSGIKVKGFKIFYYHPLDCEAPQLWETLAETDELRIIHLKRKNILRTLLSRKIAGIEEVWGVKYECTQKPNRKVPVILTAKELEEGVKETQEWEAAGDALFSKHPMIQICYEDLVSNRETVFRSLTDFLGVDYVVPSTDFQQQNPENLDTLLQNLDELRDALPGKPWQDFFKE